MRELMYLPKIDLEICLASGPFIQANRIILPSENQADDLQKVGWRVRAEIHGKQGLSLIYPVGSDGFVDDSPLFLVPPVGGLCSKKGRDGVVLLITKDRAEPY